MVGLRTALENYYIGGTYTQEDATVVKYVSARNILNTVTMLSSRKTNGREFARVFHFTVFHYPWSKNFVKFWSTIL